MALDTPTFRRGLKIVAVAVAATGWAAAVGAVDSEDPDRVRRAIGYLDARQDAWSQFARAGRGEGPTERSV